MKMSQLILIFTILIQLFGCATMKKWVGLDGNQQSNNDEDSAEEELEEDEGNNIRPSTVGELELKFAKLWTRVDELENLNMKLKARLKVIEKGLLLGITPDELKDEADLVELHSTAKPMAKTKHELVHKEAKPAHSEQLDEKERNSASNAASQTVGAPQTETENLTYHKQLAEAQDHFRQGRYGRAIASFSKIAEQFPDKIEDGNHEYWIALSWANLKEYQTASEIFANFIKSYPNSSWIPRAEFHLSKVEYELGYRDRALNRMRELIKKFPSEEAAEMAKFEIGNLEKNL